MAVLYGLRVYELFVNEGGVDGGPSVRECWDGLTRVGIVTGVDGRGGVVR